MKFLLPEQEMPLLVQTFKDTCLILILHTVILDCVACHLMERGCQGL